MAEQSLPAGLGPDQFALLAAGGGALMLAIVAFTFEFGSTMFWLVLAIIPVDFVVVYTLLRRSLKQ
ncbi:hypothetical protein [Haloarchaeobius sp. DFWS5]|uniref:hypothetical protein n=1 Tax=Haloarchaeobius sp. DFWS5 TaxID=3446114 RepID=UPI003EB7728A